MTFALSLITLLIAACCLLYGVGIFVHLIVNPKARGLPPGARPVLVCLAVVLVAFALAVPRILPL